MKKAPGLVGMMAAAALCAGCAGHRRPAAWELPPVGAAPFRGSWVQTLALEREGKTLTLNAVLETDGQVFTLAGLTPLGRRLVRLTWTDGKVEQDLDPDVKARFDGIAVLRDVVLAYWPEESLRKSLAGSAWSADFDGARRTLYRKGKPWVVVAPAGADSVVIDHRAEGYRIRVATVERNAP